MTTRDLQQELIHVGGLCYPLSENIVEDEECTMELEYRKISEERCKEINDWKIVDPYGYGENLIAENMRFVTNEDESVLFCCAFIPRRDDVDLGITQRTYLLVVDQLYYIIEFTVDDVKVYNPKHRFYSITIMEKDFINENRKNFLHILKEVIATYIKKHRRELPGSQFEYQFFYEGKEI